MRGVACAPQPIDRTATTSHRYPRGWSFLDARCDSDHFWVPPIRWGFGNVFPLFDRHDVLLPAIGVAREGPDQRELPAAGMRKGFA